jgi:hypothetical protein
VVSWYGRGEDIDARVIDVVGWGSLNGADLRLTRDRGDELTGIISI